MATQITVFQENRPLVKKKFAAGNLNSSFLWVAKSPGHFRWEVAAVDPKSEGASSLSNSPSGSSSVSLSPSASASSMPNFPQSVPVSVAAVRANFNVVSTFEGIQTLESLVGGKKAGDNRIDGRVLKKFDITFRWKPYPEATQYQIELFRNPTDPKALLVRTTESSEYAFNKDKVFSGKLYYKVTAKLLSGFVVDSGFQPFMFDFLPPILVTPASGTIVSLKALSSDATDILFTWQKTNFTPSFELEVSSSTDFKDILVKAQLKENVYFFKPPRPGKYFWRVRSVAGDLRSEPSAVYEVMVHP